MHEVLVFICFIVATQFYIAEQAHFRFRKGVCLCLSHQALGEPPEAGQKMQIKFKKVLDKRWNM